MFLSQPSVPLPTFSSVATLFTRNGFSGEPSATVVTVTVLSAVTTLPSVDVARMVAVPAFTPVTTPVEEFTVA